MCGIFAYIGVNNCVPLLIKGLERLEYRGYDSAGIAIINNDGLQVEKVKGRVFGLAKKAAGLKSVVGIAHTRWATHGGPSKINAHPHTDYSNRIAIVHNGIIENHAILRTYLEKNDCVFTSETDSEVLAHLIAKELEQENDLLVAVRIALHHVVGAFGLVVLDKENSDKLIVAKRGSPLVIGRMNGACIVASDPSALVEHTRDVVYLNDDELAVLTKDDYVVSSLKDGSKLTPITSKIDWDIEELEKGGFDYFMLKEIFEQPKALSMALAGRLENLIKNGPLIRFNLSDDFVKNIGRIIIIACGTSWHAGLVARHYFEQLTGICVEVAYASELRYDNPLITKNDLVITISQSGETADTLEALKLCKQKGAFSLGVVNVVGSSIAREVDGGLYLHAGPEIGVASTKAFTTQLVALLLVALSIGLQRKSIDKKYLFSSKNDFQELFEAVPKALETFDQIKSFAPKFKDAANALYLGRGLHFPVALEGALKLKEISYIHAEGLPAAEMKHGPIALIDEKMPVIVLAPNDRLYSKVLSNMQEVKARGGKLIVFATKKDKQLESLADELIIIPKVDPLLQPIISVIPLQLLAFELALLRGCDIDKPRNLAKAVSCE